MVGHHQVCQVKFIADSAHAVLLFSQFFVKITEQEYLMLLCCDLLQERFEIFPEVFTRIEICLVSLSE
jgi:hypothetical protein